MKIHYFQRYHSKENVATANTMLLLSRLYSYSTDKFFSLLRSELFGDSFNPEISFLLQEKSKENKDSVPDATICQESYKIVVETKINRNGFYSDQLMRHLQSFGDVKYKVLISLAPDPMPEKTKEEFERQLAEYNKTQKPIIIHINTTFEKLAKAIQSTLDDRDFEMQEILDDYLNYCYKDRLVSNSESWKYMRMRKATQTFEFNMKENVYYDNADRGFRSHSYLGLYKDKSVRAIGKIVAIINAIDTSEGIVFDKPEYGELTEERKETIKLAMRDAEKYGYDLKTIKHRYFFVGKFYETDFKKTTPYAPMGSRVFDLSEILNEKKLPDTEEIALLLREKTWE